MTYVYSLKTTSTIDSLTGNRFEWEIKHTATWVVILLGPIITLLISFWLSRTKRDRLNLWSLTRWHKSFQASRRSSAKVISTN